MSASKINNDEYSDLAIVISLEARKKARNIVELKKYLRKKQMSKRHRCDRNAVAETKQVNSEPCIPTPPPADAIISEDVKANKDDSLVKEAEQYPTYQPRAYASYSYESNVMPRTRAEGRIPPLRQLLTSLKRRPVVDGGLSEYFVGELFRRASKNYRMNRGSPPASSYAIDALESDKQTEQSSTCAVCQLELDGDAKRMPCGHCFHEDCIVPWLQRHNTCPCCRCEVESACPRHNRRHIQRLQGEVREEAVAPVEAVNREWPQPRQAYALIRAVAVSEAKSIDFAYYHCKQTQSACP
uniref:RING-type domain-containing protein n=1 Tax=Hanusia phi TaxID=3032 RepID=A0A7S0HBM6_9CRYP|mmetsp:Transcript_14791/g.33974  ORF Transcript_14791/g.33974 Transcript_14791/m.33974 type:complete len:298 (+) Transcript_14791:270-1163(+)